ncbi:MAG: phosphatidylinositol mannoside acyltransferase [Angustibacter sp.]
MSRPPLARLSDAVSYGLYAAGWRIVRLLPETVAYRLFDLVADVAWRRRGKGVRRLEANLARVRPALDDAGLRALSRAGMRSYLRYWCDSFRLPDWSHERIRSTVRLEGDEPVREALASGRGVVMFLGHLGNWDHAGAWSTLSLAPVTTVAERLRPERLFDRFVSFRERLGMTIIPLTGGSDVFRTLLRTLRDGGFVPLLADRDLTQGGVEVQLFGEPARMAVGPAALALQTGAALFAVGIHYERRPAGGHGIVVRWSPPVDTTDVGSGRPAVAALTQRCADHLAEVIAEHPDDWHMLQKVFVADLDPARGTP